MTKRELVSLYIKALTFVLEVAAAMCLFLIPALILIYISA